MSLAAYKPQVKNIPIGDSSFNVRGLSTNDISTLVETNLEDFEALFNLLSGVLEAAKTPDDIGMSQVQNLALTIARSAPKLCSVAIALAAVEDTPFEDRLQAAASMTMPTQLDALMAIGELTFVEAGGVKKFFANLGEMWSQLAPKKAQPQVTKAD